MRVDVSRSGLSIQCGTEFGQGEPVEILLASERIAAIAWRSGRTRSGFVIGMMLSELTPAYEALLGALEKRAPVRPATAQPATQPAKQEPKPPVPSLEPWWKLRVKEHDGPRTRVVTLAAPSRAAAIERTQREIGPGWDVIEVRPTPAAESRPR